MYVKLQQVVERVAGSIEGCKFNTMINTWQEVVVLIRQRAESTAGLLLRTHQNQILLKFERGT